ncbi:hypothetical protein K435DRAFT_793995 [Dendrothele bispora CBS 962.96]|uniref:Uncharacterized protein n=1 Tax=Dendrothele bispora (strain CBS 962.96) TaxID=1314807 RepID=A0A4S8MDK3_DENBC|nr:hypothetical protein K435DRAFT_793995 [Dendrothele bispora CBS 962.96]
MLEDVVFYALMPFSLVGIAGLFKGLITVDDLKQVGHEIALEIKDYYVSSQVRSASYFKSIHGLLETAGQCQGAFDAHFDPSAWMVLLGFLIGFISAWVLFILLLVNFAAKKTDNRPRVARRT